MSHIITTSNVSGAIGSFISAGKTAEALSSEVSKNGASLIGASQGLSLVSHSSAIGEGVLNQLPSLTSAQFHATNILGPVGALTALTADTLTLAARSGNLAQLKEELEKLPPESQLQWKRQILEVMSSHASGMVKSSAVGVAAGTIAATGAFVPVVGGIPATIIGASVSILRFLAENNLTSELRDKLEKITDDYRSAHPTIIQHHTDFKDLHETLKNQLNQAVAERDKAEKAYLDGTKAYTQALGIAEDSIAHQRLSHAATVLQGCEVAVSDVTAYLEEYETSKANFDAYTQALLLLQELEPKETPIGERETQAAVAARLSSFASAESIEFLPSSEFSSEYVSKPSVGMTKTTRALKEIGITPNTQKPKTIEKTKPTVSSSPSTKKEKAESVNLKQMSQFMAYGLEEFPSTDI